MKINFSGWERYKIFGSIDIEPKDFLDCEDEEELFDAIYNVAIESDNRESDYDDGDLCIDNITKEFKGFVAEWRELKSKFGDATLTDKSKDEFDKLLDELVKEAKQ